MANIAGRVMAVFKSAKKKKLPYANIWDTKLIVTHDEVISLAASVLSQYEHEQKTKKAKK